MTQRVLLDWFKQGLHEYINFPEFEQEWREIFNDGMYFWKGKLEGVKIKGHPYVKQMYPFIVMGRNDGNNLWPLEDDPRVYIALLFFSWAKKLCKRKTDKPSTTYSIKNFTIIDKYIYIRDEFSFKGIEVTSPEREFGDPRHEYKLGRQIIIAYSGTKIYTVTTGVPYPADAESKSKYIKHVDKWLSKFQLGLDEWPEPEKLMASTPSPCTKIFISYSHTDKEWLDQLKRHLEPVVRKGHLDCWDYTHIRPGDDWKQEIRNALDTAHAAVLLISADFFASIFIDENELPPLLAAAQAKGVRILPVIISASRFARIPDLARFQAVNPPDRPLNEMSIAEQEKVFERLAQTIESIRNPQ